MINSYIFIKSYVEKDIRFYVNKVVNGINLSKIFGEVNDFGIKLEDG